MLNLKRKIRYNHNKKRRENERDFLKFKNSFSLSLHLVSFSSTEEFSGYQAAKCRVCSLK